MALHIHSLQESLKLSGPEKDNALEGSHLLELDEHLAASGKEICRRHPLKAADVMTRPQVQELLHAKEASILATIAAHQAANAATTHALQADIRRTTERVSLS